MFNPLFTFRRKPGTVVTTAMAQGSENIWHLFSHLLVSKDPILTYSARARPRATEENPSKNGPRASPSSSLACTPPPVSSAASPVNCHPSDPRVSLCIRLMSDPGQALGTLGPSHCADSGVTTHHPCLLFQPTRCSSLNLGFYLAVCPSSLSKLLPHTQTSSFNLLVLSSKKYF